MNQERETVPADAEGEARLARAAERLRKSLTRQSADARRQPAREAGRRWAEESAEADQLDRLARLVRKPAWPDSYSDIVSSRVKYVTVAQTVHGVLFPVRGADFDEAARFWEKALGDPQPEAGAVRGFVEAAVELWAEVRARL